MSVRPAGPAEAGQARCVIATDGTAEVSCTVANTGALAGTEVVQLYLRDPAAQVMRPGRLAGRLRPGGAGPRPGGAGDVRAAGNRIVEPGLIEVAIGASSADLRLLGTIVLEGDERPAGPGRVRTTPARVSEL